MPDPLDKPHQPDPIHRRSFLSYTLMAVPFIGTLLAICFAITPILKALATHGWQDVYWEECFTDSTQHKASDYNHYYIKNNSVVKTPGLTFTFVANVLTKNILCSNGQDIEQLKEKVYDPNSHYVLAIDGCGNDIKSKQDNAGSTRMWVEYNEGLEKNSDTKIALYWASNKKQVLYNKKQLYKGTPNTKDEDKTIYPTVSDRKLFIKHLGKLIIAVFLILPYVVYRIYAKKEKIEVRMHRLEKALGNAETLTNGKLQKINTDIAELNNKQQQNEKQLFYLNGQQSVAYKAKVDVADIGEGTRQKLAEEENEEYKPEINKQIEVKTAPDSQSPHDTVVKPPIKEISNKKKKSDELESSEKNS